MERMKHNKYGRNADVDHRMIRYINKQCFAYQAYADEPDHCRVCRSHEPKHTPAPCAFGEIDLYEPRRKIYQHSYDKYGQSNFLRIRFNRKRHKKGKKQHHYAQYVFDSTNIWRNIPPKKLHRISFGER